MEYSAISFYGEGDSVKNEEKLNLLDDIYDYFSKRDHESDAFLYLSDLKRDINRKKLMKYIENENAQDYSLRAWIETYEYITSNETNYDDKEAIKEQLLEQLNNK